MTSAAPGVPRDAPESPDDFSFVLGGPLFQLLRRAHLVTGAMDLVVRRIVVLSLLAWLPLFVLAAFSGQLLSAGSAVPFLKDVQCHVRFLVAMPLLIAAELVVHLRLRSVVEQFRERRLVPESSIPRFEAAITSAFRLRNSVLAEVLLIALVYGVGILWLWRRYFSLDSHTWYATPGDGGTTLTTAGVWYAYVSVPLFQFLLVRWYFRLFIWTRFLWQVSRIDLSLVPTHPDRVGGLGFLAGAGYALAVLAAAHGALLSGHLANLIFFTGAKLTDFKVQIGVVAGFLLCAVHVPLLFFSGQLAAARRRGVREYGTLAERYVREFDAKWLRGGAPPGEPLVGSADIQSLADLGNSYEVVREMRGAPVTRRSLVTVVVATLAPMVPLLLTMMNFEELVKTLAGIVF